MYCVPSRIWTVQGSCVALFNNGGSGVKAPPPGTKPRISGGSGYRVEFHDRVWSEHCEGLSGLGVKKELVVKTSSVRQLASDESPTVSIKDTPPAPRPVGRSGGEMLCERSERYQIGGRGTDENYRPC